MHRKIINGIRYLFPHKKDIFIFLLVLGSGFIAFFVTEWLASLGSGDIREWRGFAGAMVGATTIVAMYKLFGHSSGSDKNDNGEQ